MKKTIVSKPMEYRKDDSFTLKVGDKILYQEDNVKGVITDLEKNPALKPYVFRAEGNKNKVYDGKEFYAERSELILIKGGRK